MEYNPFTRDIQTNPYPTYKWLRDEAPVYHNPDVGFYTLSRFNDVVDAHLDPATYISKYGPSIEQMLDQLDVLIATDEPDHRWQRRIVSRVFTPRAIADLEPKVHTIAAQVLDDAHQRGVLDVVPKISAHLPMMVIAEMLGVPMEMRAELRELSDRMLDRSDSDELGNISDASMAAIIDATASCTRSSPRRPRTRATTSPR